MAENEKRNTPSHRRDGNPSDTGKDKATIKEGKTTEELKKEEKIRGKHTDEGKIPPHLEKNSNRNTDKPDIDKPAYGGA